MTVLIVFYLFLYGISVCRLLYIYELVGMEPNLISLFIVFTPVVNTIFCIRYANFKSIIVEYKEFKEKLKTYNEIR